MKHCSSNNYQWHRLAVVVLIGLVGVTNAQNTNFQSSQQQQQQQQQQPYLQQQQSLQKLSEGVEQFSMELFRTTATALRNIRNPNINIHMSPFSIWNLLVLITEGAGGKTYQELKQSLRLPDDMRLVQDGYRVILAALQVNTSAVEALTTQLMYAEQSRPFEKDYEDKIRYLYGANLTFLNFNDVDYAFERISRDVSTATNGKIQRIVRRDEIRQTQLLVLSAIYFRGSWKYPFNRTFTVQEPFYDDNGAVLGSVDMMFQRGPFPYTAIPDLDSHVLELPYGTENRLSMIILLPRKGTTCDAVIDKLGTVSLNLIRTELRKAELEFEDDEVEIHLPRFSFTSDFTLNSVLASMGINDVFDQTHADLSRITRNQIYLSKVIHKAVIEVNEEGSIASAVTGGIFANKATPPRVYANRPFLYMIVEKTTNLVVFFGKVADPQRFAKA